MKNGLIIDEYGNKSWYLNDLLHREDGPAVEYVNGYKCWYLNGKLHREDGPAVEWDIEYADDYKRWYLDDKEYTDLIEYQSTVNLKAFW